GARARVPRTDSRSARGPGNKVGSRDRQANTFRRALRLPAATRLLSTPLIQGPLSQLDRVALHLIIERGAVDAEQFRCLLFIAVAFCKRLNDRGSFDVVECLDPGPR